MPTNPKVVSEWTSRIVPTLLAGVVGYATYVFLKPLCSMFPAPMQLRPAGLQSKDES